MGPLSECHFTGWVDFEEVPSYFHASDITGSAVGKSGIGSEIAPTKQTVSVNGGLHSFDR